MNSPLADVVQPKERSAAWFFAEFWVIMLFVGLFTMMFALPLIIAGAMPIQGLLIPTAFIVGFVLALLVPRVLGLYLLLLLTAIFVFQPQAIEKAPAIAAFYGSYVFVIGLTLSIPSLKRPYKTKR